MNSIVTVYRSLNFSSIPIFWKSHYKHCGFACINEICFRNVVKFYTYWKYVLLQKTAFFRFFQQLCEKAKTAVPTMTSRRWSVTPNVQLYGFIVSPIKYPNTIIHDISYVYLWLEMISNVYYNGGRIAARCRRCPGASNIGATVIVAHLTRLLLTDELCAEKFAASSNLE